MQVIHFHPRFQDMLRDNIEVFRVGLNLGDFGAPTKKPLFLLCSDDWPDAVRLAMKCRCPAAEKLYASTEVVTRTVDEYGLPESATFL